MSSSKRTREAPVVVELVGQVGIAKARALRDELEAALGADQVTIDLNRATYVDATVVQLLIAFRRARAAADRPVTLKGPSEMLGVALEALGLLPLLTEVAA